MDLLIEESSTEKVPLLLQRVIEIIFGERMTIESETLQKDLFFVVVLVLLKENGFKIMKNGEELIIETIDPETFSNYKYNGVYEVKVVVSEFRSLPLKLLISSLGSAVMVNMIIEALGQETYSMCLSISRYVVSPQASTVPMVFRDLKHLATALKNKIIAPVKSRVISYYGYPSASLMGLPNELLCKIVFELPINDIISLIKTCSSIQSALDDGSLWHELYKRDFDDSGGSQDRNWKELYKQSYLVKQNKKQQNRSHLAGSMHDYMDYSDFVSYIDNPMWNVV